MTTTPVYIVTYQSGLGGIPLPKSVFLDLDSANKAAQELLEECLAERRRALEERQKGGGLLQYTLPRLEALEITVEKHEVIVGRPESEEPATPGLRNLESTSRARSNVRVQRTTRLTAPLEEQLPPPPPPPPPPAASRRSPVNQIPPITAPSRSTATISPQAPKSSPVLPPSSQPARIRPNTVVSNLARIAAKPASTSLQGGIRTPPSSQPVRPAPNSLSDSGYGSSESPNTSPRNLETHGLTTPPSTAPNPLKRPPPICSIPSSQASPSKRLKRTIGDDGRPIFTALCRLDNNLINHIRQGHFRPASGSTEALCVYMVEMARTTGGRLERITHTLPIESYYTTYEAANHALMWGLLNIALLIEGGDDDICVEAKNHGSGNYLRAGIYLSCEETGFEDEYEIGVTCRKIRQDGTLYRKGSKAVVEEREEKYVRDIVFGDGSVRMVDDARIDDVLATFKVGKTRKFYDHLMEVFANLGEAETVDPVIE